MALKDIINYYNEICDQYHDLLTEIRDFEEEAKKGLIEPERLDEIKKTIQPLIANYQTLSYIMFLLNKPVKKEKHKKYEKQNTKILKQIAYKNTKAGLLETNNNTINEVKKITKRN